MQTKALTLITLFIFISCGKNAFLNGDSNLRSIISSVESDCKIPSEMTISAQKDITEAANTIPLPLDLQTKAIGEHSDKVLVNGVMIKVQKYSQVLLPFDLSALREVKGTVGKVEIIYSSKQVFNRQNKREPQICESLNSTCSGDFESIRDYIEASSGYNWINDGYTQHINEISTEGLNKNYLQRNIQTTYNLTQHFENQMALDELPKTYVLSIADDQIVKEAKLKVTYCAK